MMETQATVFVVDDHQAMRSALCELVTSVGMRAEGYPSADDFLEEYVPERPGCLVLDVRMPGMDGLQLQRRLKEDQIDIPIIFVTGHGDVPMAVQAMQEGAFTFLEKPFREQALLDNIRRALALDADTRKERARRSDAEERIAALTAREREVLNLVLEGMTSKAIAQQLGVSIKTVNQHRWKIMDKMQAENVADLARRVSALKDH